MMYVVNRSSFLEINRYNSFALTLFILHVEEPPFSQFLPADLTPAAWCSTEINDSLNVLKDVEDIIDL